MERKTLLLSASYMPIQILHWQTAIKMRYEGTADVVIEYDEEICGPSVTWKLPAVMRVKRSNKHRKTRPVRFSRSAVYIRDGNRCQFCGKKFKDSDLTLDHVVPRCRGGQTTFANIVSACKKCNGEKGDKSCDDWGKWPLKKPVVPAFMPDPGPRISSETMPPEWEGFCSGE